MTPRRLLRRQRRTAAAALRRNGIDSHVTGSGAEARRLVSSLLPDGAEVYNNTR